MHHTTPKRERERGREREVPNLSRSIGPITKDRENSPRHRRTFCACTVHLYRHTSASQGRTMKEKKRSRARLLYPRRGISPRRDLILLSTLIQSDVSVSCCGARCINIFAVNITPPLSCGTAERTRERFRITYGLCVYIVPCLMRFVCTRAVESSQWRDCF